MKRHLTTAAYALAALFWTLGQGVLPDMGTETSERLDAVAADPTLESISAGLLVLAGACLVLAAVAGTYRLATVFGPRRAMMLTGCALTGLGGLWLVGGRAAFNLMFVRVVEAESVARDGAVELLDSSGGVGFVPLVLMLPCLLLGPLLLAIGLKRAGLAGWLPLAAWVTGIAVFLGTEFVVKAGEVAGIALAGVGLVLVGRALDVASGPTTPARSSQTTTTEPATT